MFGFRTSLFILAPLLYNYFVGFCGRSIRDILEKNLCASSCSQKVSLIFQKIPRKERRTVWQRFKVTLAALSLMCGCWLRTGFFTLELATEWSASGADVSSVYHRWAQIANPLISEAKIFISRLAVPLAFKHVNRLVIEANLFSQSARKK